MPVKVLVLTVGGSCDPIVNAIRLEKPDFVYFLCSAGSKGSKITVDGPGRPCKRDGEEKPSIVSQVGLTDDSYEILEIDDPDDMEACYRTCEEVSRNIKERFEKADNLEVIANYTGGTKTMSAALAVYALDSGWPIKLNVGVRSDLVKVKDGDTPTHISVGEIAWRRKLEAVRLMVEGYYYAEAQALLESILGSFALTGEKRKLTLKCKEICRGFNLWDRFDHQGAKGALENYASSVLDQFLFLKSLLGLTKKATGYEKVVDLMLNAERRAYQRRYDDAVARLYRAVELLAQIRLEKDHGIKTGDLDLQKIPEHLRQKYGDADEDGKIRIGLRMAYSLLGDLGDEIGKSFREKEKPIGDALKKRNESILAHGDSPIDESTYNQVSAVLMDFLKKALDFVGCPFDGKLQFPRTMEFCSG